MKKGLPPALLKQQEQRKNETLNKVQSIIDALMEEGTLVTKKLLIELTGYSASTFSKSHIKELLEKNKVCQFREKTTVPIKDKQKVAAARLIRKNEQLEKQSNQLKDKLLNKDIRIMKLEEKLEEKDERIQRLIGKIHQLERQAELNGHSTKETEFKRPSLVDK